MPKYLYQGATMGIPGLRPISRAASNSCGPLIVLREALGLFGYPQQKLSNSCQKLAASPAIT